MEEEEEEEEEEGEELRREYRVFAFSAVAEMLKNHIYAI